MDPVVVKFVGVGLIFLGLWFFLHNRRTARMLREAGRWPSVEGRIVRSELERMPGAKIRYRSRIEYEYNVAGQSHTGKTVALGGDVQGSRSRAKVRCDNYPEGSNVDVYYNPSDPQEACLERKHDGALLEIAAALFGVGIGIALLLR